MGRPPGVLVAEEPRQENLDPPRLFEHKGYSRLPTRARYDITARVLRKEVYRLDGGCGLAPVDLGVGWGPMSDTAILDRIEFSSKWDDSSIGRRAAPTSRCRKMRSSRTRRRCTWCRPTMRSESG